MIQIRCGSGFALFCSAFFGWNHHRHSTVSIHHRRHHFRAVIFLPPLQCLFSEVELENRIESLGGHRHHRQRIAHIARAYPSIFFLSFSPVVVVVIYCPLPLGYTLNIRQIWEQERQSINQSPPDSCRLANFLPFWLSARFCFFLRLLMNATDFFLLLLFWCWLRCSAAEHLHRAYLWADVDFVLPFLLLLLLDCHPRLELEEEEEQCKPFAAFCCSSYLCCKFHSGGFFLLATV